MTACLRLLDLRRQQAGDVDSLGLAWPDSAVPAACLRQQVPYSDCTRDNPLAHTVLEMGYGQQELAAAVAADGLRPSVRLDTPQPLAQLLQACWDRDPCKRPRAADVGAALQALAAQLEPSSGAASTMECDAETKLAFASLAKADTTAKPCIITPGPSPAAESATATPPPHGGLPTWLVADTAAAPSVFCGSFLAAGKRDKMEDYVLVLDDCFRDAGAPGCTLLGVFDGHR